MQKRRPIDKNIKSTIWTQYNKFSLLGECYACGKPITHDNFEAGHNIAVANGGTDDISNLRPVCRSCNGSMGTMNLEQYKKEYFGSKSKTPKITTDKNSTKIKKNTKSKKKKKSEKVDAFGSFEINLPEIKMPKIKLF